MAGPWDKYTGTESNGPWAKYAAQPDTPAAKPGVVESAISEIGNIAKGIPSAVQGMFDPATVAQRGAALFQSDIDRQQNNRSLPYRAVAGLGQSIGINAPQMEQQADQGNARGVIGTAIGDALPVIAISGAREVAGRIPTKAGAGALLDQAKRIAGDTPINVETPGQHALRMQALQQAGSTMPRVVQRFLSRITDPDGQPMTYAEARDFYSNATAMSANENARLSPVMRFNLNQFRVALGQSIQEAANQSGAGDLHSTGMQKYAQAAQLQALKEGATKYVVKPAIGAAAGAAGAKAAYDAYQGMKR